MAIQIESKGKGIEEILREVEPPLPFDGILKISIPVAIRIKLCVVMRKVQRGEIGIRLQGSDGFLCVHVPIDCAVLVSGAVIIAKGKQRSDLKL